jgi:hypothetical protein
MFFWLAMRMKLPLFSFGAQPQSLALPGDKPLDFRIFAQIRDRLLAGSVPPTRLEWGQFGF